MKTYARIEEGVVAEIIKPMVDAEGNEIPIEARFHPDFVAALVDITDISPQPKEQDRYDGAAFHSQDG
ncbi:hypothetical protein CBA19CS22_00465 [Caballeronia novacaledonica]|uniref:Uncharacterized protein n=1 Tax=Caballeronia novacaledonica TaxID=1544861 RepID=A0ACB5QK25_9BURK|nr:hypothetical protein CBA19CS22_00465 [Caballeronia novacaledonica]